MRKLGVKITQSWMLNCIQDCVVLLQITTISMVFVANHHKLSSV